MSAPWTPERIEQLEQLAPALTAEAVAGRLGLELAQVLGKARRLGLSFGTGAADATVEPAPIDPPASVTAPPIVPEPPARPDAIDVGDPKEGWTERRLHALEQLHGKGYSATDIAAKLRGVTRNAVIGKINRLRARGAQLARRRSGIKPTKPEPPKPVPTPKSSVVAASRPRIESAPKPTPPAASEAAQKRFETAVTKIETSSAAGSFPEAVDILGLTHNSCRFPLWAFSAGPDEPRLYCGARKVGEMSAYCARHTTLAYTPSLRRAS